ncbi:MAG TPA: hypothetical protein VJ761_16055 [Ktedonobacteraceae bacterium]|nr:hypothetical protein [Ktedonobacteraceae bacterium]
MRATWKLIIFCTLMLFLLAGCASTSTPGSTTHAGVTPKPTLLPTPIPSNSVPTPICLQPAGRGVSLWFILLTR